MKNEKYEIKTNLETAKFRFGFYGAKALSEEELIYIISGAECEEDFTNAMKTFKGDGENEKIECVKELMSRYNSKDIQITGPQAFYNLIRHHALSEQEKFIVGILNGANHIKKIETITFGLVDRTLVHPREVFAPAIRERASSIIIAHNHPSGSLKPSEDDIAITQGIIKAGQVLGIRVLDHVVISQEGYMSMDKEKIVNFDI